jgi:long-chain acyl-CoA synthetase
MILTEILEKNAAEAPKKQGLVMRMGYRTVSLTYEELCELAKKTALFLEINGLKKGDKVLLLAPNSPYWVVVFWGTLLRGCIVVPLNIQSTPDMVQKIAEQTEARILFKSIHYKQKISASLKTCEIEFLKEILFGIHEETFQKTNISESDTAEILYTSGTTGDPKGVVLTHKNIESNVEMLAKTSGISERDRFLSILPLSHIFEQVAGFLVPYKSKSTIVYAHSPTAIRDLLKEYRITMMAGVPEFLRILLSKIEAKAKEKGKKQLFERMLAFSACIKNPFVGRILFHSVHKNLGGHLRAIASGGAPLDPVLEKKWNAMGLVILQGYGLTETSPVLTTNTFRERHPCSVGKPLPGITIKIDSDGEVLAKGPNIFGGYFKSEEKTTQVFTKDGWFRTGDIGELNPEGFLFLKGRKKYMILGPGGQNVYPEDIETELNKHPRLKDSCVVGLEKEGGQVEIHAVLLLESKLVKPQKLIDETNANLASYQQITAWSVWPEEDFPRSATRKVAKEKVLQKLKELNQTFYTSEVEKGFSSTPLVKLLSEITNTPASRINPDTRIVPELSLDSLLRIELVTAIEEKFSTTIDEAKITPQTKVSDLEEIIKRKEPPAKKFAFKNWPLSPFISFVRIILQYLILFPAFGIFVRLKVEGKENLKNLPLPAIFMPNHLSYLDSVVILMALPFWIRKKSAIAAAQDVLYVAYKSWAGTAEIFFNAFPFPRQEEENVKFGLEYVGKLLDRGQSVIIYPEGKISLSGELEPLKRGAGLIAVGMEACIVPVQISGTQKILPFGRYFPQKRDTVRIVFGKPIRFKRSDSYIEATEKIYDHLVSLRTQSRG